MIKLNAHNQNVPETLNNLVSQINNQEKINERIRSILDRNIKKMLPLDGSKSMTGDLNLGGNQIINIDTTDFDADTLDGYHASEFTTRSEWYQNGFKDVDGGDPDDDISITWDDATRTLSLAPKAPNTEFTYYRLGYAYTETNTLTKQIADEDGLWVFYIDSSGLSSAKNPSHDAVDDVIEKTCIVAYVYWNSTLAEGRLMWEAHGMNMSPATHHWIHDNIGARYREGMALSGLTVDSGGDLDSDVQFDLSEGVFYDEDIEHIVTAIDAGDSYDVWHLDGSTWAWENTDVPGLPASGGSNRLAYNDATLGTQVEIGNNDFGLIHIYATNIMPDSGGDRQYIFIQGQGDYTTKGNARDGAETEINTLTYGTLPLQEIVPVATLILQTSNGHDNSIKSRLISTNSGDDYIDWRSAELKGTGGSVQDHGSLAGLSDNDHDQYVLRAGNTTTTPSAGDILQFGTEWDAHTPVINDLADVDATSPGDGDVLTWVDGNSAWEAVAPSGGGLSFTLRSSEQTLVNVSAVNSDTSYTFNLENKDGQVVSTDSDTSGVTRYYFVRIKMDHNYTAGGFSGTRFYLSAGSSASTSSALIGDLYLNSATPASLTIDLMLPLGTYTIFADYRPVSGAGNFDLLVKAKESEWDDIDYDSIT
jgi:hypothetical protein